MSSELRIVGMTVSCDFGDKNYGNGNGRFISVSSKVPEASAGIPLDKCDDLMSDGIDMYYTAWQTALLTRYATGEIGAEDFKKQTAGFLVRIERIKALYQKIKGKSLDELDAFLKKAESEAQ